MSTLVILIRHAKAEVSKGPVQNLTESGRMMQSKVNKYLKKFGIVPDAIWTSPVPRARETATMIADTFEIMPKEELALADAEMFDEAEITQKLSELPDRSTVILVSHGPQIMHLATYLLGSRQLQSQPPTSSALFIEFDDKVEEGKGRFTRMITYSDLLYEPDL